jgi:hypothetical protein
MIANNLNFMGMNLIFIPPQIDLEHAAGFRDFDYFSCTFLTILWGIDSLIFTYESSLPEDEVMIWKGSAASGSD